MKNYLSIALLLLQMLSFAQSQTTLYFDTDSDVLSKESISSLQLLADSFSNTCVIHLVGHTDSVGSLTYNEDLSERRCNRVRNRLAEIGIPDSVMYNDFKGELSPRKENATEQGRSANRRVDVVIECPKAEVEVKGSIQDLFAEFRSENQVFTIQSNKDTILIAEGGTLISIDSGSYNLKGCPEGSITISFREGFDASTMILDGLSTTSNKKVLETGGMVFYEARDCNGKLINPRKKDDVTLFIPSDGFPKANMQLFRGVGDPHGDGVNWLPNGDIGMIDGTTFSDYLGCMSGRQLDCPFFFCGISNGFAGVFSANRRDQNSYDRKVRKRLKNDKEPYNRDDLLRYGGLYSLIAEYGVEDVEGLFKAMGIPESFSADMTTLEVMTTLNERQQAILEASVDSQSVDLAKLNYYVFNMRGNGWKNIDSFLKLPASQLARIRVDFPANASTKCTLVFKQRNILLNGSREGDKYSFSHIPKGKKAYLIAMQYDGKKSFLNIQEIKIESRQVYNVELKELSKEEFKTELEKISW